METLVPYGHFRHDVLFGQRSVAREPSSVGTVSALWVLVSSRLRRLYPYRMPARVVLGCCPGGRRWRRIDVVWPRLRLPGATRQRLAAH
jgi:hypothetical protein